MTALKEKTIALTFDDGPSPDTTPMLLDILSAYKVPASFCVLGSLVSTNEEILQRIVSLNCEIVNHSWNHENLTKYPEAEIEENIRRTDAEIFRACGVRTRFFRPPYGATNPPLMAVTQRLGKPQLLWMVDSEDWKLRNAPDIIPAVLHAADNKAIVLMHDIYRSSCEAAAVIIPELLKQGYELKTVSDLLKHRNPCPGQIYGHG